MNTIGWVIVALTCYGSQYSCDMKQVESPPKVYASEFDCKWALSYYQNSQFSNPNQEVRCAEVRRP